MSIENINQIRINEESNSVHHSSPIAPVDNALIEQIRAENEVNAQPILAGLISPFEAFKEGCEKAIASYLQLGCEEQLLNSLVDAPQSKTEETQLVEDLVKCLLQDFNSVKFVKKEERYLAIAQGKLYHFSSLLKRVNFNHIEMDAKDLDAYHQLLDSGQLFEQPYIFSLCKRPVEEDFDFLDEDKCCRTLTLAEKEAINIYTGSAYRAMNNLMRGKIGEAIECCQVPEMFTKKAAVNHGIKETLLHIAVAVSGLNKLPDFTPSLDLEGGEQKFIYRAEGSLSEDILKNRKWAVIKGGGVTTEMGFLSAAYSKPGFFNEYTRSGVLLQNLKGKKITPLSRFGDEEREVLLPPTQMRWLQYKDIVSDVFQNQITLFLAQPVTVSPDLALDYEPMATDEWVVKSIDADENALMEVV